MKAVSVSGMLSRRRIAGIVAGIVMAAPAATALAQTRLIRGEVIDVECYVAKGARGEGHKQCAIDCIQGGQPAGILEEKTGKIYLVVTRDHAARPSEKIMPYIARMVEAEATVQERGGITVIDIKSIKEIENPARGEAPPKNTPTGYAGAAVLAPGREHAQALVTWSGDAVQR